MFTRVAHHNGLDRRSFLLSAAAAGAAAMTLPRISVAQTAQPAVVAGGKTFAWSEVDAAGKRKGAMLGNGDGGNTLLFVKGKAAVLVDTKMAPLGGLLATDASGLGLDLSGKGEALVINTHHHYDHTGGNDGFVGKVPVLAHPKAIERIATQADLYQKNAIAAVRQAKAATDDAGKKRAAALDGVEKAISTWNAATFTPTRSMEGARQEVTVGGITLILRHFGSGHTDNDMVVYSPELNVLHTGDLLFHKVWPYFDIPSGATSSGWAHSLSRCLELCDKETIVVPGHGGLTDRTGIRGLVDLLLTQSQRARDAVKAGQSREDFIKTPTPEHADYAMADWIRPITLGGLYDEAKAFKP